MKKKSTSRMSRREALKSVSLLLGGTALGAIATANLLPPAQKNLEYYVAYGGGTNIKHMPNPSTGQPTIPLEEVWYFDLNRAFCRVDNNPEAFAMDTYKMGRVVIDAKSFSMVMLSKIVHVSDFTLDSAGVATLKLNGNLGCATAASVANTKIGGRDVVEPAPFQITAVHNEKAGDSFAFTVFFQKDVAPINYAIFGSNPTFTGDMSYGAVTIKPAKSLTLLPMI